MIDTLVFDIGMVLIDYDYFDVIRQMGFSEEAEETVLRVIKETPYLEMLDRGTVSHAHALERYKELADIYAGEIEYAFTHAGEYIKPLARNVAFLQEARKKGYRNLYLSNFDSHHWALTRDTLGFAQYLEGGIVSCEEGVIKPEPEIYRRLIDRWKVRPERAVFIDDRRVNTAAAEKLGFFTITLRPGMELFAEAEKLGIAVE